MLVSVPTPTCPCGSGAGYPQCCSRFHNQVPAPSAELLMRARYSAYVMHNRAFIIATWHPTTRPADLDQEVDDRATRWLGLEVVQHRPDGDQATVEFVARYKLGGRAERLHEVSSFVREAGWWWYVDGSFPEKKKG